MHKKLVLNQTGFLNMNIQEIKNYLRRSCHQLSVMTPNDLRLLQYRSYSNFVFDVLGVDIEACPKKDPFYSVTGYPFKKWYLEKHYGKEKRFFEKLIILPTTDYMSAENLLALEDGIDEFDWKFSASYKKYLTITGFDLIPAGGVMVNRSLDWIFYYGVLRQRVLSKREKLHRYAMKGIIFLEPEPLGGLKKTTYFDHLYQMLVNIGAWFNHDMTGHGTFDLEPLANSYEKNFFKWREKEKRSDYEDFFVMESCRPGVRSWFAEFRQLNMHMRLVEAFFMQRPALKRYLKRCFFQYNYLLRQATQQLDLIEGAFVYDYFIQVYLFCLLRIVERKTVKAWCCEFGIFDELSLFLKMNGQENLIFYVSSEGNGAPFKVNAKRESKRKNRENENFNFSDLSYISHREIFGRAATCI